MKQIAMEAKKTWRSSSFHLHLFLFSLIFGCFSVMNVAKAGNLEKGMELYTQGEYKKAFILIKKSADAKEPEGEAMLAYFYANGIGTKMNDKKSAKWYQKAANQGVREAQYQLGKMYDKGIGLEKNNQEAVKWYKLAAEKKHIEAQLALGLMYMEGRGIDQSKEFSMAFACELFVNGDENLKKNRIAQYYIGFCYENGKTMLNPKANEIALDWYQKAAKQEYVPAISAIGSMYFAGRGVKEDYVKGVRWYQEAAEKGDSKAQAALGLAYEKGLGVEIDLDVAIKWYSLAAEQGQGDAKEILNNLMGKKDNEENNALLYKEK